MRQQNFAATDRQGERERSGALRRRPRKSGSQANCAQDDGKISPKEIEKQFEPERPGMTLIVVQSMSLALAQAHAALQKRNPIRRVITVREYQKVRQKHYRQRTQERPARFPPVFSPEHKTSLQISRLS